MKRCVWCGDSEIYQKYHDEEWGVPVYDDQVLFEFLILEGAQAGLSWITVLKKRKNYRTVLDDFDYKKIAGYSDKKLEKILTNSGIIRNRLKVYSVRTNAQKFLEVQKEFGTFSDYLWSFTDKKVIKNSPRSLNEVPATTELSDKISKNLKKRGFKFIGSTIVYAYLQAVGVVDDHVTDCFRHKELSG